MSNIFYLISSVMALFVFLHQYLEYFVSITFHTSLIAVTVLNKFVLLNYPIFDDDFILAKLQIYEMSYLFSSYPNLDFLTLIALSCCYTTHVFFASSINVINIETSFSVTTLFWNC